MIAGVGLDPGLIITGALAENLLVHRREAENLVKEVNHLFGAGQTAQVAIDDDTVETVIYKNQQAAKQLAKQLHRSSPRSCL